MSRENFKECNSELLKCFNIFFTFEKKLMLNAKKEVRRNFEQWLTTATKQRNGHCYNWQVNFPHRPVHKNDFNDFTFEQLSAIYMIDGYDVKEWEESGALIVASKGNELSAISSLKIDDEFESSVQYRIRDMKDWSEISNNCSPCTDIVIVDRYLFAQSEFDYDTNSFELIDRLCGCVKDAVVSITIFTQKNYKVGDQTIEINQKRIICKLKERLSNSIGCTPNVTIVTLPANEQHDRTIVTNYKMFFSGDSFKYFKNGDNVSLCSHGEWLVVSSLHKPRNMKNAKAFMDDLQIIIDNAKKGLMAIQGDMQSRVLRF